MRATEHAPRGPFYLLERRHALAEIIERGARVIAARPRVIHPHRERDFITSGVAERRLRESTLLQVVPKGQARLPSSACLSTSFSYHADLLEDDGDGLRTPPGARGGAGQLI